MVTTESPSDSTADPVLPHEDRKEFEALLARYRSDFAPVTAHQEFLISQMAGARWKLDRVELIENFMFGETDNNPYLGSTEAMAHVFMDKDNANAFARLDRYRASLERTYHRCARELRATRKEQNEANSTELAEKKLQKLVKKMVEAAPPGFEIQARLVPIQPHDKNSQDARTNGPGPLDRPPS